MAGGEMMGACIALRRRRMAVIQYVKFCLVGGSGLFVDMVLLHLLASPRWVGLDLSLSKVIAAEVAMLNNFFWNEVWTFRVRNAGAGTGSSWWARLAKFNLICTTGIGLSVLLLQFQVRRLGVHVAPANFIAIVLVSLWNFVLVQRFGWGTGKAGDYLELKDWQKVLGWLVAGKVVYFVVLMGALALWPDFDQAICASIRDNWFPPAEGRWLAGVQTGFARHFTTWDAAHYLVLGESGYFKGLRSCAFYPLWPMMIRLGSQATGASPLMVGMVLANILSLAGWTLFWSLSRHRFGTMAATWALVFLVVFPGSVFYQFVYTEPLFLLLLMGLWWGLETRHLRLAGLTALLLPMTRAVGVFALLPILWHALMHARNGALDRCGWLRAERERVRLRGGMTVTGTEIAGLVAAPFLGWAVYFGLMTVWTGNPFEGFDAQTHWRAHSIANLFNPLKFVLGFLDATTWHEFRGSLLDRCGFLMLVCCLPVLWRLGKDLVIWTCVLGVVPAMSGTFISFIRFESVVFPVFIALGARAAGSDWRRVWGLLASGMALVHLALLWRFVNHGWAG